MFVKVITPPAIEAIQLDEARSWLRIDVAGFSGDTTQDGNIRAAIAAARRHCEQEIDFSICKQKLIAAAPRFSDFGCMPHSHSHPHHHHDSLYGPNWETGGSGYLGFGGLKLPQGPVRSVDSIEYIDATTGSNAVLDDSTYRVALDGRLLLTGGARAWPNARFEHESVRITYWAGYEVPGDRDIATPLVELVGEDVVMAIRLLTAHFYINRSATLPGVRPSQPIPLGVADLLRQNRASIGI